MALFEPPVQELLVEVENQDQLVAHRRASLYPGTNPTKKYRSACYYAQHVLGIDIAPFHQSWILDYCFMGVAEDYKGAYMAIATPLYDDISLSDQEINFQHGRNGMEVISFRGSIKSTIFQMLASWELQRGGIDVAIGTYSAGQIAKEWIPNFRNMLELSKLHLDLDWIYETDNQDRKVISWFVPNEKNPDRPIKITSRLMGIGHRGAIRMIHPDMWIIDDWLDKKMESTLEEAERVFKQEVFGTRTPGSKMIVIGTILAEGDLLFKIKDGEIGARFFKYNGSYPGYLNEDEKIPRWHKRGVEFMEEQLDVQGEIIFQIEFMLNPINDKQALVSTKYIELAKDDTLILGRKKAPGTVSVTGNDFQFSESASSDWGVNFVLEYFEDSDVKPQIRILEMERYQGKDELEIVDMIEKDQLKYRHQLIGFEINGFQRVLANIFKRNNILWPIYEHNTGGERNHFQIGIPSLKQIFTNFDIAIPWGDEETREQMSIFIKEIQAWQYSKEKHQYVFKGRYKDTTLAFWIAILTLRESEYGRVSIMGVD